MCVYRWPHSFVMPDEDVDIVVTVTDGPKAEEAVQISEEAIEMPRMLLAAASADDDEDWDEATQIEANIDEKNIVDLTDMEERELLGKEHLDYVAYERRSKRTDSDSIEHDFHV